MEIKKDYPQPNQVWQHYKGGKYQIVAMCNHTTTDEVLVIYKSMSFGGFHARPYSEWHEQVGETGAVGFPINRFVQLTYLG